MPTASISYAAFAGQQPQAHFRCPPAGRGVPAGDTPCKEIPQ